MSFCDDCDDERAPIRTCGHPAQTLHECPRCGQSCCDGCLPQTASQCLGCVAEECSSLDDFMDVGWS